MIKSNIVAVWFLANRVENGWASMEIRHMIGSKKEKHDFTIQRTNHKNLGANGESEIKHSGVGKNTLSLIRIQINNEVLIQLPPKVPKRTHTQQQQAYNAHLEYFNYEFILPFTPICNTLKPTINIFLFIYKILRNII